MIQFEGVCPICSRFLFDAPLYVVVRLMLAWKRKGCHPALVSRSLGSSLGLLIWLLISFGSAAQTNINFTSSTLVIGLNWNGQPIGSFGAAGSIQVSAAGVFSSTLSESVTTLTRLPPTNAIVHVRYGGSTGGQGADLVPARVVLLEAGKTNRLDFDLCQAIGLVTGTVTLNGGIPPPFRLVTLSDSSGQPWIGARTDDLGRFKALVPIGSGKGQVQLVAGQGAFSYEARGCEQIEAGEIAVHSAALEIDLLYKGQPVSTLGANGSVAVSAADLFGRIISMTEGGTLLGFLPASTLSLRFGYGATAFEPGSPDLVAPKSVELVAGITNRVLVELSGSVGLVRGRLMVNGKPAGAGVDAALFTSDGRTLASGKTSGDGVFQFLVPAGSGSGRVYLVDGQGGFAYSVAVGGEDNIGDLNVGSGAVLFNLAYDGRPISNLQANTAILVRADGILTNTLSADSTLIQNLPPLTGVVRVGFGSAILGTESDFLPSTTPIPIRIVPGTTNTVLLDLCGPLGLVQGRVLLNNQPVPAGTLANLFDFAGRGFVGAVTDANGVFRALVPAGPGKGSVQLIAGQGNFSFRALPCSTTDLGGVGQNQVPHLDPISDLAIVAGSEVRFTVTGRDTDSTVPLLYSLEPGAPSGAVINPVTGEFRWTPPLTEGGFVRRILITGTDSGVPASSDTIQVSIRVTPHRSPEVAITSPKNGDTVHVDDLVFARAEAVALDSAGIRTVEFFDASQLLGSSATPPFETRLLNLKPGVTDLIAIATDLGGVKGTSAPVRLQVILPVNHPPVFDPLPAPSQVEGREVAFTVRATDVDSGQSLSYALGAGAPIGARIDAASGWVQWTPPRGSGARTVQIPVVVSDTGSPAQTTIAQVTVQVLPYVGPSVQIIAPASGFKGTAPASIQIEAQAIPGTDAIRQVEFFDGPVRIGGVMDAPYRMVWNNVAAGEYTVTARATDVSGGGTVSRAVSFTVVNPNQPPAITLVSPTDGSRISLPASMELVADATDLDGMVVKVEFFEGSTLLGSVATPPHRFLVNPLPEGTHVFTARATDNSGASTVSTPVRVTAFVPKPPPSVRLIQPVDGTKGFPGTPISLAVDLQNFEVPPVRVEYLIGGSLVASSVSAPFATDWIAVNPGIYSFSARAVLSSGVAVVSPAVTVTVGENRSEIAVVSKQKGVETAYIAEALGRMGRTFDFLAADTVGPGSLFGYRLAIWTDDGDAAVRVMEPMIAAFESARLNGTALYFVGEHLFGAASGLSPELRTRWYQLLRAIPSGSSAVTGAELQFRQFATDHPLIRSRNGLVENFHYPGLIESSLAGAGDVEVDATVDDKPVLLMAPAASSSEDPANPNTVTQLFLHTAGTESSSLVSRDALFGNAVDWLVGHLCFSQVVRSTIDFSPAVGNVGDEFSLILTLSAHGECGATGVEVIQPIPSSWQVLSTTSTRGSVSFDGRNLAFTLGRLPLLIPETLTVTLRPSAGGTFTNLAAVHWNEAPGGTPLSSESIFTVTGTAAPFISLDRSVDGRLLLKMSSAPGITLQLESSADLIRWNALQTIPGGDRTVDLGQPAAGNQPSFFRVRVLQ